jgi:asparagine synthase (glutamine-hydrolysing)
MANSLEVRVPFLDHRLVEFVARLPKAAKYRPEVSKALLVEALEDVMPDEVSGQDKRTFTLPWEVWLRGPLGVRLSQDLANITPALLRFVGQTNWSRPWSLYVLNQWVRRHMTGAVTDQGSTGSRATAVRPAAFASGAASSRT